MGPRRPVRHQRPRRLDPAAALGARGGAGIKSGRRRHGRGLRQPRPRTAARPTCRPSACAGYDFVANDRYPNDRSGHGTFVASAIAAAADNHFGMIGVAYRAGHHARARPRFPRRGDLVGHRPRDPLLRGPRRPGDQPLGRVLRPLSGRPVHDHELARRARRDSLRRRAPSARRRRRRQLRRGRDPLDGASTTSIIYVGATTEHGCLADYSNFGHGGRRGRPRRWQ